MRRSDWIALTALLTLASPSFAGNLTPSRLGAFLSEPYGPGISIEAWFEPACRKLGHPVTVMARDPLTEEFEPNVGWDDFVEALSYGYGVFGLATHASDTGWAVMTWPLTDEGFDAMTTEAAVLVARGLTYDVDFRAGMTSENFTEGYSIKITPEYVAQRFVSSSSIVYTRSCDSEAALSTAFGAARVVVYKEGISNGAIGDQNARVFFEDGTGVGLSVAEAVRMTDNEKGLSYYPDGAPGSESDHGNTALGIRRRPGGYELYDAVPSGGGEWWFEFSADFNLDTVQIVELNPSVIKLSVATWTRPDELGFILTPYGQGTGGFTLTGDTVKGLPYVETFYFSHYHTEASDVPNFAVVDGRASWNVALIQGSESFRVEGALSPSGPWRSVTDDLDAEAGHEYEVVLSDPGLPLYRLVESETLGGTRVHGAVESRSDVDPPFEQEVVPVESSRARLTERLAERGTRGERWVEGGIGRGEALVVYAPPRLVEEAEYGLAQPFAAWPYDYSVTVQPVDVFPSDPDAFRQALAISIQNYAQAGVRYFLLVGDANDHAQFVGDEAAALWIGDWEGRQEAYFASGYPVHGQPERDFIPTWYEPDNQEPPFQTLSYWVPYTYGDLPYADTNGDGLPDVVLGRLPVSEPWEVALYAANIARADRFFWGVGSALKLVGDFDHTFDGSGEMARSASTVAFSRLDSTVPTWSIRESLVPSTSARNEVTARFWNDHRPDLVAVLGLKSVRTAPGWFFNRTTVSGAWTMNMVHPYENHLPVAILGSCGGADFARTEDSDYGRPIAERFLTTEARGASVVLGPTLGSLNHANSFMVERIVGELLDEPERPIAESFMVAQRTLLADARIEERDRRSIRHWVALGHPLQRPNRLAISTATPDAAVADRLRVASIHPNPFNPSTQIEFSLPQHGRATLKVFDLRGRLVRSLLDASLDAGAHAAEWDGRSDDGSSVATGVYLYRLEFGGESVVGKMSLVK